MRGAGETLVNLERLGRHWTARRACGLGLGLGLAAALAGCGGSPLSSADTSVGCSVTVLIPSSGSSLLGSVKLSAGGKSYQFSRNVNTILLGCGDQATLSAVASNPAAHPFIHWTVSGGGVHTSATLTVTVNGLLSIQPAFRVPKAALSPTPTPTPKVSPTPSAAPTTVVLDQWVSYDSATQNVTWKAVAGSPTVNLGLNFDGYYNGAMVVTVPEGWSVTVDFSNSGSINHSAAVVTATGTTPIFPGAATPSPTTGTAPGQTATFTFTASQVGSYRMSCLIPGHEARGMWAGLVVASGGLPSVKL